MIYVNFEVMFEKMNNSENSLIWCQQTHTFTIFSKYLLDESRKKFYRGPDYMEKIFKILKKCSKNY